MPFFSIAGGTSRWDADHALPLPRTGNRLVDQHLPHACFRSTSPERFLVSRFVAKTWPAFRSLWRESGMKKPSRSTRRSLVHLTLKGHFAENRGVPRFGVPHLWNSGTVGQPRLNIVIYQNLGPILRRTSECARRQAPGTSLRFGEIT